MKEKNVREFSFKLESASYSCKKYIQYNSWQLITSCWYSLVNEVVKTPFLFWMCVRKQRCKHTSKKGLLNKDVLGEQPAKATSFAKANSLKSDENSQQDHLLGFLILGCLDFYLEELVLLQPHYFELVGLCQQDWEITNHSSETTLVTELQMVPVKEISQKFDHLILHWFWRR